VKTLKTNQETRRNQ